MGRNMFGPVRGEWDRHWSGWWGDDPPFHAPVFVLTHHAREPQPMEGGTTFHFVTDGIESALAQARAAAGDGDISIHGGATTINQYLAAGLVDELRLHIAPVTARRRRAAVRGRPAAETRTGDGAGGEHGPARHLPRARHSLSVTCPASRRRAGAAEAYDGGCVVCYRVTDSGLQGQHHRAGPPGPHIAVVVPHVPGRTREQDAAGVRLVRLLHALRPDLSGGTRHRPGPPELNAESEAINSAYGLTTLITPAPGFWISSIPARTARRS